MSVFGRVRGAAERSCHHGDDTIIHIWEFGLGSTELEADQMGRRSVTDPVAYLGSTHLALVSEGFDSCQESRLAQAYSRLGL